MGFCRRCGDIVAGVRCHCGGTAVAPVVPWNHSDQADSTQHLDKWSKTYVQRAKSVSPTRHLTAQPTGSTTTSNSPTKRFPRPLSHSPSSDNLNERVSAHIASSTSDARRSPSPLKYGTHISALDDVDILPSLNDTTLSKVYGSILQPKESLATHSCALCSSTFPPDATIYPDPASSNSSRFLCRPCYEANGGTKGLCPTCSRPVLTLKSEGQFIHAADQYWHKKCFNCIGCFKYIGDSPMVDLLGRPSCADCFESCLKRDPITPKKYISTSTKSSPQTERSNNVGGMGSASKAGRRSVEGSPTIEELEKRLRITPKRRESPAVKDLSQMLALVGNPSANFVGGSPRGRKIADTRRESRDLGHSTRSPCSGLTDSPVRPGQSKSSGLPSRASPSRAMDTPVRSPAPTAEAIEEMKHRFTQPSSPSRGASSTASPVTQSTSSLRLSRSSNSMRSSSAITTSSFSPRPPSPFSLAMQPLTPDLMSDYSDTTTQSSLGPDSPPRNDEDEDVFSASKLYGAGYGPRYTPRDFFEEPEDMIAEETTSQMGTPNSVRSGATPSTPPFTSPSRSKTVKPPAPVQDDLYQSSSPLPPSDSSLSICQGCGANLFSIRGKGKFVTVPGDGLAAPSMTYHVECFRCAVCDGTFSDKSTGQAVFVKANGGACHVECAPPAKVVTHKMPSATYTRTNASTTVIPSPPTRPTVKPTHVTQPASSSRLERLPHPARPTLSGSFPRFGSSTACPGCTKSVSLMEQGVVPGPQNTRWHASCLVCGGKKETPKGVVIWRGREEKKTSPGCGKRLDSAAKSGIDGEVWCRECLLLLGVGGSPQPSPTRTPLSPSTVSSKLTPQITGTTTIARQFTGLGTGADPGLLRQLTGGGLSPTRSISPTKQMGNGSRPRPKSVIGMRSTRSVDEGRGMFLVRQMTGTN